MTTFEQAREYALKLSENTVKITMKEFFTSIHSNYYSDHDISFMNYFLELCDKEGQFVVPHTKLIEYGIMTSTQSNDVKTKINRIGLKIDEDFLLRDVSEQKIGSGGSNKRLYILTPEAFKLCLLQTQRRPDQPIDPVIYCNYYMLLEKVFKLFTDYERAFAAKLLLAKDNEIKCLQNKYEEEHNFRIDHVKKSCNQYLYIASTKMYYNKHIYKIGKTKNIKERMQNYSTGYLDNEKIKVFKYIKVAHSQSLERYIFEFLKPYQQEDKEMFKVEYKILDDLFNKIEAFELHAVNNFNEIIKSDPSKSNLIESFESHVAECFTNKSDESELVEILNATPNPTNQMTEIIIEPPINWQKMPETTAAENLKAIGIELLSEFTGPSASHRYKCISIFQHEFECTYNNLMKYKDRGCKYCHKDSILDKVKIYRYDQDTLLLNKVFNEWSELQNDIDYSIGQSMMIKKNMRIGKWKNICKNYMHSFIGPNAYNKLDYNKQLTACESKIIEILGLDNVVEKNPIFKAFNREANLYLFALTKTSLADQLNKTGLLHDVNRHAVARYITNNLPNIPRRLYNGFDIHV